MSERLLMYNSEIKERFLREKALESYESSRSAEVQFRKTAEVEFRLNKDLSNWTLYEIIDFYKLSNFTSYYTIRNVHSIFSMYTQFCLSNNLVLDNQNHFLELNDEMLLLYLNKSVLEQKILDTETVYELINQLPNPRDQFIVLAHYEFGKSKDNVEIANARPEDVDGNTLRLPTRVVQISDKMKYVIEDCVNEKIYYSVSKEGKIRVRLDDNGCIVKNYPNQKSSSDFQRGRNIYKAFKRAFDYLGKSWIRPNDLVESGKINMIKKRSMELEMTPKDYLYSEHRKEVEEQYNCEIVVGSFLRKYKDYLG